MTEEKFKVGDKVRYKDDDRHTYFIYGVYSDTKVSLTLKDYPDIEQDFTTDVKDIVKINED